jgi:Zn-dependent protease with chaperone function
MRPFHTACLCCAILVLFTPIPRAACETLAETDQRLLAELRARNPAAADTFAAATAARTQEDHVRAAAAYEAVRRMVPDFSHAWRREGFELLALGRKADAIARMRSALALDESAWNLSALGSALVMGENEPTPAELEEAVRVAREAQRWDPNDATTARLACHLALMTQDFDWLGTAVGNLERVAPDEAATHLYVAYHEAVLGNTGAARQAIERSKKLGLPDAIYQDFVAQLTRKSPTRPLAAVGIPVFVGWLTTLLILLVLGSVLSRITLESSRRVPSHESGSAKGPEGVIRQAYRYVLWACCAFYFLSIPLLIATILLTCGGIIYLMLQVGHVPIKLLAVVVILTAVTLWAIVKSLFIRGRDVDPGMKLDPAANPKLREVLDAVAAKIQTRPVTNVYITPGTDMAVMERGGVSSQVRGHTERCLILGLGVLEGMKVRPFRAILAHEYGHFSNRDTAGGGFALAVRRSLLSTAENLALRGAAAWYNPAWLFVNGFYRVFLRISQGASRLQEVLADRWSAFTYGARSFEDGLRHIIDRSVRFDAHADSVLHEVIEGERPLTNLYSYRPAASRATESELSQAIQTAIEREPTPYDSHPRPADRFAWVHSLGASGGPPEEDDENEVWTLFDDRDELERRLTEQIRHNVQAAHGVVITGGAASQPLETVERA